MHGGAAAHDRRRWILRAFALALLAAGVLRYLFNIEIGQGEILVPLRPLVPAPELEAVDALPAPSGALAGQNLLIVTLDTTRPDRLGAYGHRGIHTPHLDRLASDGVLFSRAVATTPMTLPSHASIFTGVYPHRHRVRANGVSRLGDDQLTLAEVLSAAGYQTAAFVSSYVLDPRFGLAQGFATYDAETAPASATFAYDERTADRTTERALEWLASPHRQPFFLWVHYFDPHQPHVPPAPHAERYDLAYDGEIAFVDEQLGRLVAAAESGERGTLIVVTADHGEAFGEHGEQSHGLLAQEATLRIPLIMRSSRGLTGGYRIDARTSQVDLMPTVLSLLGLDVPPALDGLDLTRPPSDSRPVLAEAFYGRVLYHWARLAVLYRDSWKYVDGPRPELYDLEQDPLEQQNVADARSTRARALRSEVLRLRGPDADEFERSDVDLDEAGIARLRALGYIVGDADATPPSGTGRDPKEMLPLMNRLLWLVNAEYHRAAIPSWQRALTWLARDRLPRNTDELIQELETIASERPDFAPVYVFLEEAYRGQGRIDDAARTRERLEDALRAAASP